MCNKLNILTKAAPTRLIILMLVIIINLNVTPAFSQAPPQKIINTQYQSWFSINSTTRLTKKWGFVLDAHERRNNFLSDNGFHFVRAGVSYWLKDNLTLTAGYAHLWLAPSVQGWTKYANENRLYQQVQLTSKVGKISILQRLRNEQRWQQKIANDKPTGQNKFTNRARYLLSFTVPVFKNAHYPSLVVSDELCVQAGKEVVFNTFDQNRLFLGLKQPLSRSLSFDIGYMQIKQQKASGYQYDRSHIFRLFFYYTAPLLASPPTTRIRMRRQRQR